MTQKSRGRRQGINFTIRLSPEQRIELERACADDVDAPTMLGPWLIWCGLQRASGSASSSRSARARGSARAARPGAALPRRRGTASAPGTASPADVPIRERIVLDLCAGSGSWSEPYKRAGYDVRRVTLPRGDVRTYQLPRKPIWGIVAAPPCTEFSLAKNGALARGARRDFVGGMNTVNACMRLVLQAKPRWWALENPVGLLARWLGTPSFVFEPYQFGDPWSKRTALWGTFERPALGPHVRPIAGGGPICTLCHPDAPRTCSLAEHRAITPPGFVRAFFEANP